MIPENVKAMKPSGYGPCTVTESRGRFYVMRTEHEWDADLNKNVTHHKSIGRIDPDVGFVPNAYGKQLREEASTDTSISQTKPKEMAPAVKPSSSKSKTKSTTKSGVHKKSESSIPMNFADGYELMLQCAPDVAPAVREYFGDDAPQLLAITLMRLVQQKDTFCLGGFEYEGSYASALFPDLDMTKSSVREFLIRIGKREQDIQRFLRSRITPGEKILLDGTPFFAESVPLKDSKPDPLVHAAYVIDKESLLPEYYLYTNAKVMAPDLVQLTKELSIKNGLAVLGQRSWTPDTPIQLAEAGLQYVVEADPQEDVQGVQWMREHGSEGMVVIENDPEFGPIYGRLIPDSKTGGTIRLSVFFNTYADLVDCQDPDEIDLYTRSLYTNLDVPIEQLPGYLYWLPNWSFQFLALQQTLFSPWSTMFGYGQKRKPDTRMDEIKAGLALSNFLGLLYWQRADSAAAKAKVPMEFVDVLRTARSDVVLNLQRRRTVSSARKRNQNFKLMGITHAKDKTPDPWGDGKTS